MHIPDGLMDPAVAMIGWGEFIIAITAALIIGGRKIRDKDLPRIALLSAGIFVAQILNFPIGGGTTGHLIGASLFAILAGPATAIIGMSVVIIIQALVFGDGGIVALGLNALNMAIIAPLVGWSVYGLLNPIIGSKRQIGRNLAVAAAAWASVFVAAAACAGELLVSYAVSAGNYGIAATISVPAMLVYHAVIGIGEAIITAGLIAYLDSVAPEMFGRKAGLEITEGAPSMRSPSTVKASFTIILVFVLVAPLYVLYASEGKDGLEQTMANAGTEGGSPILSTPFSYGQTYFETLLGGILGFLIVGLAALGLLKLVSRRGSRNDSG